MVMFIPNYCITIIEIKVSGGGRKEMRRKIIGILVCSMLIATMFTVVGLTEDNETNEINTIKCNVFDSISRRLYEHHISEEETQRIIGFMKDEISQESFPNQIEEKLNVLSDIGLLEPETATKLSNIFKLKQNYINKNYSILSRDQFFDVINVFNGIFFGLLGEKTFAFYELIQFQAPFLIGNMTGGFTVLNRFTGNGSVFSVGFLGIKNIHDYDPAKYGKPYLPIISGFIIGFTGVLIEIEVDEENSIYIGAGMAIATIWSKLS